MFLSFLKVIAAGMIGGFFLFMIPFLIFKAVLFFLFLGVIFRLIAGRRRYRRWRRYHSGFYGYPNGEFGGNQREYLADRFGYSPQKV